MAEEEKIQSAHIPDPEPSVPATAESLGVDQASFDKYYKDGNFNWEGYAKEQAWKDSQKPAEAKPESKPSNAPQHSDTKEAQTAVENAGLNWDDLGAKISDDGDISPEDYDALARIGVPKEVVQNYIAMTKQQSQGMIDDIIDKSGGQEMFNQVYDRLQSKPLELRNRIDSMLTDPSTRQYGIDMMFKEAGLEPPTGAAQQPAAPPQQQSGAQNRVGTDGAIQPFQSFEEQVAAQRDSRYNTDPAYREEVIRRALAGKYTTGAGHTSGL